MKYKTAEELEITPEERNALLAVKRFLGRTKKTSGAKLAVGWCCTYLPARSVFNMCDPIASYECGTALCVGGWMSVYLQGIKLTSVIKLTRDQTFSIDRYVWNAQHTQSKLYPLFFPQNTLNFTDLTPTDARDAITEFLTTGTVTTW